ncbi:hypothetical protein ACIQPT_21010 [Streptomyces sp. NPDC091289]|uniref:hypothetical protein n=1 Tax=Streptomyces sp. NPDC091289 TaxID=3365989 RepID=UPI003801648F
MQRTSSSVFLAGFLGQRDELARAEDAYASGGLDNRHVSELDASAGARAAATDAVDGGDLRSVIPALSRLVTATHPST